MHLERFGVKLLAEFAVAADAFVAVHGGLNRACRGSNASDIDASYFTSVGPARAGSLEACKILCMRTSACNAIQFSSSECQLWTRNEGVEATVLTEGVQCLKLQPFRDFDGSQDRLCEATSQPDGIAVGSLRDCQDLCYESVRCTGINFNNGICHVFTGDFSSRSSPGSRCSSFQPFVSVDGGVIGIAEVRMRMTRTKRISCNQKHQHLRTANYSAFSTQCAKALRSQVRVANYGPERGESRHRNLLQGTFA